MASDDENDYLVDNIEYDDDDDIEIDLDEDEDSDDENEEEDDRDILSENHASETPIIKKKNTLKKIKNPSMSSVNSVLSRSNKSITERIVPDDERVTSNVLKQSEYAKLVSVLATMIAKGSISAPLNNQHTNPVMIAQQIINDRKSPVCFKRKVTPSDEPNIEFERWDPNTMIIPKYLE